MKELSIVRLTPTTGQVLRMNWEGNRIPVDRPMNYGKCMDYVLENQSDIKVYKVSRTLARRNGKRRLLRSIYAHDHNEAVKFFDMCDFGAINGMYMLHTGDWKPIAHCFIRKEKREMTIID